jgi:glycerophosphoryl diester phosphodiesterase
VRLPLSSTSPPSTSTRRRVRNIAHRGASDQVAENTLAAVRRAISHDAHLVEVDVQRTRDGVLVLLHDTTLVRTTDIRDVFPDRAPWRVADFTYDELCRLDAGAWKSPACAGERLPTLAEVIDVLRHGCTGLLLELKAPELYPAIADDVAAQLRDKPGYLCDAVAAGGLVVQSFHLETVRRFKQMLPSVPVGVLGAPPRSALPALAQWADQVNPGHLAVDRSYVDLVHELGMECLVWTVNREPLMRRALRMGVDGVITNRPHHLARLLRTRSATA